MNSDLCRYEHVVYVLDALLYTLSNWPRTLLASIQQAAKVTTTTSEEEGPRIRSKQSKVDEAKDPLDLRHQPSLSSR